MRSFRATLLLSSTEVSPGKFSMKSACPVSTCVRRVDGSVVGVKITRSRSGRP